MTFLFVTHQKIRALNQQYLNRNHATDVLAFDALDEGGMNKSKVRKRNLVLCADIVISTDAVLKNAKEFNTSQEKELVLYVIHGILHLCGYDDHSVKDIKKMRQREGELLEKVFK
ncbi:Metal-dependent hydrolase YbeY, involved in rRNA and/or ribosome maturation and assembly [hydrothermal vent metagenome]|uniref:Metal-dependent hydrolase YbeY, involved in rRNA and/or ribosome maturation and assembly n=1 Tax=hydrothermal vent metagenome TaxID=652676 RepID=A0A3B0TG54_9ZZZZ